ncbi:DUF3488 and transglutaminase-like domain-containing protein [Termitidicoccus mucosus]|uniref:Transglutaminase n=1 Tax=Termitidicoccus mucosus TaxID=1184151 RepID=A0A178ILN5_9BACT|nr:transglutaminase [Opitutaceae bacterium TSB47]
MNPSGHYRHWVLLTLVLAALPSLATLPPWVAGIALAGGVLHYLAPLRGGWPGRVAAVALLSATAAGIWFGFESWFGGKAVLSFFIAVVFLKWGEARTRRDYLLLIFAAVILAAVGALYWETLWSLAHMLVVIFALTLSLVAIHGDASILNRGFLIRRAGQLFLLGLPLMLLLFLTFPRIPGPLWDIGLAFGLPVKAMMNRGAGDFGKITTLEPGGIHEAGQANENVLVAEFKGAVPFKSLLYWRGPVFWDYDGKNWTLPEDWDNRTRLLNRAIRSKARLDRELRWKAHPVRYTLRVMPNGGRWLYGLDVPAAPAPEALITDEFQLVSIRRIDDQEPKFPMLAYLDYHVGAELTEEDRARGLSWPDNTNPRLHALGRRLAGQYADAEEIVHQAFSLLADGGYRFDAAHIIAPGPDLLDRYFFDEKKGGAEYLAGSFAMLMRAAGVPARLVGGYRGGTIIALTNFVIVKRSDAHAWVEVWHEGKGWRRVEPKDVILPPETKRDKAQEDKAKTSNARVEVKPADEARPPEVPNPAGTDKNREGADDAQGRRWDIPDFSSLFGNLQKWVIRYDPDRQMDLLKGVGLEESNWLDLLVGGALGVLSLLCAYLAVAWWRGRTRIDSVTKAWLTFCRRLQKLGLQKRPQECPRNYLARASRERPELAAALADIIGRYIDIRYGGENSPAATCAFRRQVDRFVAMT